LRRIDGYVARMPVRNKQITTIAALGLAGLGLAATAGAAAVGGSAPAVSVRIEGAARTLVHARMTQSKAADVTRGGAPSGACPGSSAIGALAVATHGSWVGKWLPKHSGYLITSVDGERSHTKAGWRVFVAGQALKVKAACAPLKPGQRLLFANVRPGVLPLGLTAPATVSAGQTFRVAVVQYTLSGHARPAAGATVSVNGASGPANGAGLVPLTPNRPGTYTIVATKAGYIRDEATVTVR